MSGTIREAVEAAARQFCICDGECFETRHGMMHGPCEQDFTCARRTIADFLRALPVGSGKGIIEIGNDADVTCWSVADFAAAVEAERE